MNLARQILHRISDPNLLNEEWAAAEVVLRAGVLTGWIGRCKQIEGAQEEAKNLISEAISIFE